MSFDPDNKDTQSQAEWEMYLQAFLDESDEDLESLSQALLRLEADSHDREAIDQAFRLLHTHKGSAGLMGFEGISDLAHQLENRFDEVRSGSRTLGGPMISALLRCVDFLQAFNAAIRAGDEPQQSAEQLLEELEQAERQAEAEQPAPAAPAGIAPTSLAGGYVLRVEFEDGLQLADMKARLIVARLSNIGQIIATDPPVEDMETIDELPHFVLICRTERPPAEVIQIANVDGVKSVKLDGGPAPQGPPPTPPPESPPSEVSPPASAPPESPPPESSTSESDPESVPREQPVSDSSVLNLDSRVLSIPDGGPAAPPPPLPPAPFGAPPEPAAAREPAATATPAPPHPAPAPVESTAEAATPSPAKPQPTPPAAVAETVRVGIDRLDTLMNLTGELVITRERISQITDEINSLFRGAGPSQTSAERLHDSLQRIRQLFGEDSRLPQELLRDLAEDLDDIEQRLADWEDGRRHFHRISEAVDQLNRVSGSLQQSVLDTRMVPVAPLFNRFRRVIRDLAAERNKQVQLEIHGEKTELDKRMIDELADPLLHLVRNSLDHGLEMPETRRQQGKPETGRIVLEASHSGNNVFITVSDDGAGLNSDGIRRRAVQRGLVSEAAAAELNDQQVVDFIWRPGFSTAEQVTELSGRGVGMDVVNSRIAELNGSIEVSTTPGAGTQFRIRLPLTLAIIRCLLVRFRRGSFALPIDDVREIVAVEPAEVHAVHGGETIDVRGEFIPLLRMDRVFTWHDRQGQAGPTVAGASEQVSVVILRTAGRMVGLCVDELLGSGDVVIKSLADNFVDIQGLSGASIMGDGTVCLMLDTSEIVKLAAQRSRGEQPPLAL